MFFKVTTEFLSRVHSFFICQFRIIHPTIVLQRKFRINCNISNWFRCKKNCIYQGIIWEFVLFCIYPVIFFSKNRCQYLIKLYFSKYSPSFLICQNILKWNYITWKRLYLFLCFINFSQSFKNTSKSFCCFFKSLCKPFFNFGIHKIKPSLYFSVQCFKIFIYTLFKFILESVYVWCQPLIIFIHYNSNFLNKIIELH